MIEDEVFKSSLPVVVYRALDKEGEAQSELFKRATDMGLTNVQGMHAIDRLAYFNPRVSRIFDYESTFADWLKRMRTKGSSDKMTKDATLPSTARVIGQAYLTFPDILKSNQLRVAALYLNGQTLAQIADQLIMVPGTVNSYLSEGGTMIENVVLTPAGFIRIPAARKGLVSQAKVPTLSFLIRNYSTPQQLQKLGIDIRNLAPRLDQRRYPQHNMLDLIPNLPERLREVLTEGELSTIQERMAGKSRDELIAAGLNPDTYVKRMMAARGKIVMHVFLPLGYYPVPNNTKREAVRRRSMESAIFVDRAYLRTEWEEAFDDRRRAPKGVMSVEEYVPMVQLITSSVQRKALLWAIDQGKVRIDKGDANIVLVNKDDYERVMNAKEPETDNTKAISNPFLRRLRIDLQQRGFVNVRNLSNALKGNNESIRQWWTGDRIPTAYWLQKIFDLLQLPPRRKAALLNAWFEEAVKRHTTH